MNHRFTERAATELRERVGALTEGWIEAVIATMHYRPQTELPLEVLRDRGPALVCRVAGFIDGQRDETGNTLDHVRRVVEVHRARGHDAQEILRELNLLGEVLYDAVRELAVQGDIPASDIADGARRLHRGMAVLTSMAAGLYEDMDREERRAREERAARFRDDLAHEIKNLLGAALGALDATEDLSDVQVDARMRELTRRNIRRALDLVDDLRVLIDENDRGAPSEPRPVEAVIDAVLDEVSAAARDSGVELRVGAPLPEAGVEGERVQLALVNLVWNAVKYSDLSEDRPLVEIGARLDGAEVLIHVRDNGVGIPQRSLNRVFERFFRVEQNGGNGSGLGLSIAREAVRQTGGDISVESELGVGTTFLIRTPAQT